MGREEKARQRRDEVERGIRTETDHARKGNKAEVAHVREIVRGLFAQSRDVIVSVRDSLPRDDPRRNELDRVRDMLTQLSAQEDGLWAKLEAEAPEP